jgi:predicted kinase
MDCGQLGCRPVDFTPAARAPCRLGDEKGTFALFRGSAHAVASRHSATASRATRSGRESLRLAAAVGVFAGHDMILGMPSSKKTTLYLLCGRIAAGKSTLALQLAARPSTLLISEDQWTSKLFGDDLKTIDDYSRFSERLRSAMGPHVVDVLRLGVSVVLDFPANVVSYRDWMRSLFNQANVAHELHFLDTPVSICKRRLYDRNAGGKHPFHVTEAEYDLFTSYFEPPKPDEGFNIIVHRM